MAETQTDRGRDAHRPTAIPKAGWRDIVLRVKDEISRDHVSVVSAGVAFFGLLAVFPAIVALVSIAGLLFDVAQIQEELNAVVATLPEGAGEILTDQVAAVLENDEAAGWGLVLGLALALYSASAGMKTLMEGMNIAYDERESRGFIWRNVQALGLTLMLIFGLIVGLGFTVAVPAVLNAVGLGGTVEVLVGLLRWPVLALLTVFGLAVLYRFGPSRATPRWKWVSPGAVVATVLWIAGSLAFTFYVENFGTYNETYGSLGAIIVLLTWLWLSAFIVLLGAELNSEIEHQTEIDSTTGKPMPMGARGAVKADTIGRVPDGPSLGTE